MRYIYFISLTFALVACNKLTPVNKQQKFNADIGTISDQDSKDNELFVKKQSDYLEKEINGMNYSISFINGLDYVKRATYRKIDSEDESELAKESVIMLEFSTKNEFDNIFHSEKMNMQKDDAVQYLIGDILKDIKIIQDSSEIFSSNHSYEGQLGAKNKLRVTFYFNNIDLNHSFQIEFYDRLFGNGIIKFNKNTNTLIS